MPKQWKRFGYVFLSIALLLTTCTPAAPKQAGQAEQPSQVAVPTDGPVRLAPIEAPNTLSGIHKIQHVIIIMQENRSFDNYFGTFPGADGIPMKDGVPSVCVPDPLSGKCVRPFHDAKDRDLGGPHGAADALGDINHGQMNGFILQFRLGMQAACRNVSATPACRTPSRLPDVMGYHDAREIPNYWAYAENFVLQDHMFQPDASWTLPAHLFMVSGWSARCETSDPMSCRSALQNPGWISLQKVNGKQLFHQPVYAWTDLTYLLHKNGISWAYYLSDGTQPDCEDDQMTCPLKAQNVNIPQPWNPLPYFTTVQQDHELSNIQPLPNFFQALKNNTLPQVVWIVPDSKHSEHPGELISDGQAYVTHLINAVMQSKAWDSSAIFLAWDDWGGLYDHVVPPMVDQNGYGLRVPGLVISPYAKRGYIDHQVLSFDAYLKFIEDDFLSSQRIDPKTDGRPDPRPTVRENVPLLGNLIQDFDFNQSPRPPLLLPERPKGKMASIKTIGP